MTRGLALATMFFVLPAPAAAQVMVQGTVVNADSARLPGAQIEMIDSAGRIRRNAVSDSAGRFAIRLAAPLQASRYLVRAQLIGYQSTSAVLSVEDRQVIDIVLTLDAAAIPLEPLRVTARSRYTRTSRDEYYDRLERVRRMGGGTILEYDQLQRRIGSSVALLVAEQYPGSRGCPPAFFIDGMRATNEDVRALSVVMLEGIEIYRSVAQVPVQYQNRSQCGAVLIWTQVGDRGAGSPLTWRRVLIAAGLIGLGILILR